MLSLRRFALRGTAAAVLLLAACSPDRGAPVAPVAPVAHAAAAPNPDLVGGVLNTTTGLVGGVVKGLLPCKVTQSYTTSKVIGPFGGTIKVGPHSLVIPAGALASNTLITATAPVGDYVQVQFEPHGLQFARPSALTLSYAQCGVLNGLTLKIVYADDQLRILEVLPSLGNVLTQSVTGKISHFSGYLLAD
jgi:hypothetical protein